MKRIFGKRSWLCVNFCTFRFQRNTLSTICTLNEEVILIRSPPLTKTWTREKDSSRIIFMGLDVSHSCLARKLWLIEKLVTINWRITLSCVDLHVFCGLNNSFCRTSYPSILKYSSCIWFQPSVTFNASQVKDCCFSIMADVYNVKFWYIALKKL